MTHLGIAPAQCWWWYLIHCVLLQGYHGDTSKMFMVGNVSEKAQDLCRVTKHCLGEAIKICGPGVPIREVGKVSSTTQELLHHSLVIVPCLQAACVNDCTNCKAVHIFPFSLSFTQKSFLSQTLSNSTIKGCTLLPPFGCQLPVHLSWLNCMFRPCEEEMELPWSMQCSFNSSLDKEPKCAAAGHPWNC